jgi:hypothetical protein
MVVTWSAGARLAEFAAMRRVAAELSIDTAKIAIRVSGQTKLDGENRDVLTI